jgi:hypothetical protein
MDINKLLVFHNEVPYLRFSYYYNILVVMVVKTLVLARIFATEDQNLISIQQDKYISQTINIKNYIFKYYYSVLYLIKFFIVILKREN